MQIKIASSDTVLKRARCSDDRPFSEALLMDLVHQQTSIPVPAVRRTVKYHRSRVFPDGVRHDWDDGFFAMEYVRGQTLAACWSTLSLWSRLRVVWELRQHIRELRRVQSPFSNRPGPLGGSAAQELHNLIFYEKRPHFETVDDLTEWYSVKMKRTKGNGAVPLDTPPFPDASPLVITHADLHHGNIILDDSGRVWVIDWGHSGYFPIWFEFVTAALIARISKAPDSWLVLLPLVTGPHFAYESYAEESRMILRTKKHSSFTGLYPLWQQLKIWLGWT